jgi:hypothetical protein
VNAVEAKAEAPALPKRQAPICNIACQVEDSLWIRDSVLVQGFSPAADDRTSHADSVWPRFQAKDHCREPVRLRAHVLVGKYDHLAPSGLNAPILRVACAVVCPKDQVHPRVVRNPPVGSTSSAVDDEDLAIANFVHLTEHHFQAPAE